ncbi:MULTISPECIES: SSI family serine proteinase inhibitor [Streptomyces]|uniref:Subtilase-type protease inhibitor n=1 Tax=Streptomyces lasiicapitis TaxID=1923961 RepID=A0ABQ2N0V8_9ACTN|nr:MULTISPECIES: SSI family serine proteinase inhibitor [Streptomyces]QIB44923.1 hypothetical protein G3H79_19455 [Streptomyces aureoverticillatus]GGO59617.1 subtilase-type protease inhibitor [Streptomyces lasiicapitis]
MKPTKTVAKIAATLLALGTTAVLTGTAQASAPTTPEQSRATPEQARATPEQARAAAGRTDLRLTLTHPETDTTPARTTTLKCGPTGGTHPSARSACAELAARRGTIEQPPAGGVCTMVYAPVLAEATGTYDGRRVSFKKQYGNDCELHQHTGVVFEF